MTMDFISPQEWGARVDYDTWNDRPFIKDNLVLHWGGNAQPTWEGGVDDEQLILRAWERWHIDGKHWRGLAYGYAIGASGTVYRVRGSNNYGAHSGDQDGDGISNNREEIPVVFIMGEGALATPIMWDKLGQLKVWLEGQPWTDGSLKMLYHKEVQTTPTQCPGPDNIDGVRTGLWLPEIVTDLEPRVAALEANIQANNHSLQLAEEWIERHRAV